jgi:tetratricopeptide (TPR) repeat protein
MTPEAWRSAMQVAIRNLVRARCTAGPRAVLLLEDMQWADSASREALEFLLCNCEVPVPILVLISQRSDLDECALRLSPMTEGYVLVRTICLHPLDQEHARAMMRLKLGFAEDAGIPGGLEERLLERSEGNPYYIEEMLSELVGKGVLVPDGDRFALGAPPAADCMPASIAGLIRSRIDRLPADLRRALQIASVLGAEFDEGIFGEMCRQEGIDSGAALDRLSSFRLIERRSGRHENMLAFRSLMARDAMYENLLHHNRTVLHRRAARAMEGHDSRDAGSLSGALALHWHSGGEPVKAIRCGTGAAASLAENYQHDEADSWIDRLEGWLPEVEEGPLRDELRLGILLVRIAVLENRMSLDLEAACSEAIPLAGRLNLPVEEARAAYALGTLLVNLGRPDEARRLIDSSLEVFEREDLFGRAINARFALADMLRTQGRLDEADGIIQAGLAEARRRNAPRQIAACLASLGGIRVTSGDFVEARALFSEALSIERALGQTRGLSVVLTNLGVLYGMADEIEKALECFEESMKIQVELGTRKGEGIALNNMGNCFVALERVDEAKRCFERSLLIHMETGGVKGQAVALVNLGNLAEDSGDLEGAAKNFETAIEMQRKAGNEPAAVNARCLLARIWVKQGRTDDAKKVYIESAAAVERMNLGQAAASPVSELRRYMIRAGVPEEDLPLPARWSGGGPGREFP